MVADEADLTEVGEGLEGEEGSLLHLEDTGRKTVILAVRFLGVFMDSDINNDL